MLAEFVAYLKANSGYARIMKQLRQKVESLGYIGGTIRLEALRTDERAVLQSLFRKGFSGRSASFPADKFVAAFNETRYAELDFMTVLNLYFGETIRWKKDVRNQYETAKSFFFEAIITHFEQTPAGAWLKAVQDEKGNAYTLLNQKYRDNPDTLNSLLNQVCQALNDCTREKQKKRLALFASEHTRDPHAFDMNRDGGHLLLYALCFYSGRDYPRNAEEKMELLYQSGLIYDEVSNYVICRGIHAYLGETEHPGFRGFTQNGEPLHVSLWNLGRISRVRAERDRVFVFENPTVFSEIAGLLNETPCSMICSAGNIKVATLILLDMLCDSGSRIYYCGDLDPEGLIIADKLKKRYGEKLLLWHFDSSDYQNSKSDQMISASRLKKLAALKSLPLKNLAELLIKERVSAYQELLVEAYVMDIKKWLEGCPCQTVR